MSLNKGERFVGTRIYRVNGVSPSVLNTRPDLNLNRSNSEGIPKTMYFGIGRVGHIAVNRRLVNLQEFTSSHPGSVFDLSQWEVMEKTNEDYLRKVQNVLCRSSLEESAIGRFGHNLVIPQGRDWDRVISNDQDIRVSYLFALNYLADSVVDKIGPKDNSVCIPELNMVDTQTQRLTADEINQTYNRILTEEGQDAAEKYKKVIEYYYRHSLYDAELPTEENIRNYLKVINPSERKQYVTELLRALNMRTFRKDKDSENPERRQVTGVIDGLIFTYDKMSPSADEVTEILEDFKNTRISLKNIADWHKQGKIEILKKLAKAIFTRQASLAFNVLEFKFELDAVKESSANRRLERYSLQTAHEMMAFLETLSLFVSGINVRDWLTSQDDSIGGKLVVANFPCILRDQSDQRWGILLDPPNIVKDTLNIENPSGVVVNVHTLGGFDIAGLIPEINQRINTLPL